jgi:ketosteroid isomerase-like protein
MIMKRSILAILILAMLLISPQSAMAQQSGTADEVRAAVLAFGRAFVEADIPALRGFLTDDYIHVNGRSGSVLNSSSWLKWMESRKAELISGELVIDAYDVKDLEVEIYKETAMVTGVVESRGRRKGVPIGSRLRFTNVWVMQGGSWRRAMFHDSPLTENEDVQ